MGIYTTKEYQKELAKRSKKVKQANQIFTCVSSTHADMMERIFEKGLNKFNSPHGSYSTKPTYMNANFSARKAFQPVGKTGKTTFKSGEAHKTKYFAGGYKQFKSEAIGTSKVNFQVFGELQRDWTNSIQLKGDKYVTGTKRKFNSDKVDGLISRFGIISFQFSEKEREKFNKCVQRKYTKIMQGA